MLVLRHAVLGLGRRRRPGRPAWAPGCGPHGARVGRSLPADRPPAGARTSSSPTTSRPGRAVARCSSTTSCSRPARSGSRCPSVPTYSCPAPAPPGRRRRDLAPTTRPSGSPATTPGCAAPSTPSASPSAPTWPSTAPTRPTGVAPTSEFVLRVGRLNVRKNLGRLFTAAGVGRDRRRPAPAARGRGAGGRAHAVEPDVRDAMTSGAIRFLGRVDDGGSPGCTARVLFVFLSLDEGFGLPPVEALASAAPCSGRHRR